MIASVPPRRTGRPDAPFPTPPPLHARRLREWRRSKGLTLRQLADMAGVHFQTVGFIERGSHEPVLSTIQALVWRGGVPREVFL